jgi:hypothetical protein
VRRDSFGWFTPNKPWKLPQQKQFFKVALNQHGHIWRTKRAFNATSKPLWDFLMHLTITPMKKKQIPTCGSTEQAVSHLLARISLLSRH